MKLYLKRQSYQEQQPEAVSANPGAVSTPGVRIYLKAGAGVSVPKSFPSVSAQTVTPAPAPSVTPSVKIPAAQTFSLGRALTSGRVVPSSTAYAEDNAEIGQYGYGMKSFEATFSPSVSETAKAAHDLTGGVNRNVIVDLPAAAKKAASAPFAAASNALTRTGAALDKAATGKEYSNAIRAARWERYTKPTLSAPQKNPYQADAEALANVAHMTDAEQIHALELSGDSERGAYIQSLNLTSRRRAAESDSRAKTAAEFESNTGKASKRESPEGRVIAANATRNPSYDVGKVQNVSG